MSDDFLGIDHVPFNYRLREARQRMGWNRTQLGTHAGVGNSLVGRYEALQQWPSKATQERLAAALQDASEYLFPPEVGVSLRGRRARVTTSVLSFEMLSLDAPEMRRLVAPSIVGDAPADELPTLVAGLLDTLRPQERLVLEQRYGLNGEAPRTLRGTATSLGVSSSRVQQVHNIAIRKLRHHSRSQLLAGYG